MVRTGIQVVVVGALATLVQAVDRFVLGSTQPFPPEALAEALFARIPMEWFSLGVSLLGFSAKWVAFASVVVGWALVVGLALTSVARPMRRWSLVSGALTILAGVAAGGLLTASVHLMATTAGVGGFSVSTNLWIQGIAYTLGTIVAIEYRKKVRRNASTTRSE